MMMTGNCAQRNAKNRKAQIALHHTFDFDQHAFTRLRDKTKSTRPGNKIRKNGGWGWPIGLGMRMGAGRVDGFGDGSGNGFSEADA